jgi:hypothetical protein
VLTRTLTLKRVKGSSGDITNMYICDKKYPEKYCLYKYPPIYLLFPILNLLLGKSKVRKYGTYNPGMQWCSGSGVASGPAVPPGGTNNFQKNEEMFYSEALLILKI